MGIPWFLFIFYFCSSHKGTYGLDSEILADVKTPNRNFGLKTMNYFIELANKRIPNLDMIKMDNVNLFNRIKHKISKKKSDKENDVQILYSDRVGSEKARNYIVVHYTNSTNLHVYDSMDREELSDEQNKILNQRYGNLTCQYRTPSTRHICIASNGPLSIAYATLLIFQKDVEQYRLHLDQSNEDPTIHLRQHILDMFQTKELKIFPEANFKAPLLSNQITNELNSINEPISDVTINYFIQMVRLHSDYDMISLLNYDSRNAYEPISDSLNDVQILYGDKISVASDYYICIWYYGSKDKRVHVYDVLMRNALSARNIEIIRKRYPSHHGIVYVEPEKKTNSTLEQAIKSSGAVSIGAAVTWIKITTKQDRPRSRFYVKDRKYKRMDVITYEECKYLRSKILSMFEDNDLCTPKWKLNTQRKK